MDGKNMFTFMFGEDNKNSSYYLETVTAALNGETHAVANLTTGKATMKASYKCESGIDIALSKNVTMHTMHVQFQAYQLDQDKFGTAVSCADLSPIIPIVVGSVLAALVLIVIIAYLIGRRRSRSGYEEI
ncbi:unnamed protein product [Clavelina lepadiformis]|uniref:Lysosome-associated membrane glycoprotein 1 n=1 Tax=Clavelina lepadiformis TaxID=159417 RepID=A0ABP0H6T3_CLALP